MQGGGQAGPFMESAICKGDLVTPQGTLGPFLLTWVLILPTCVFKESLPYPPLTAHVPLALYEEGLGPSLC